jgi:hypothetical protein
MGRHYLPFFPFSLTPTFLIYCFLMLLVLIKNSVMFINIMFLHTCDAMCKVVKKKTFFGLHHVTTTIGNLKIKVAQHAAHALNKLNLDMCNWII